MAKAPMTDESSHTSGPILGRMPSLTQHAAFESVLEAPCGGCESRHVRRLGYVDPYDYVRN
jgi:hypothetical protein